MIWLVYDPITLVALVVAYVVGFAATMFIASRVAPNIARRFSERLTLHKSMLIAGLLVVVSGLAGIGLVASVLLGVFEAEVTAGIIASILLFVLVLNVISYIMAPLLINVMYGARPNAQLQDVVNRVASKLGLGKPPKAVVVKGPPNAFAYGNFIVGRYVAVSSSLMEMVTPEMLEAIVGHELGHHKHRDNAIMLFMGLIPSVLYFLGVMLIRLGVVAGYTRTYYQSSSSRRGGGGGGGLVLLLAGVIAVAISFIVQIVVLAFSRLREYYADTAGAHASSPRSMQRALAALHLYYSRRPAAMEAVSNSKLRALFIYAFTEAYANPYYRYPPPRDIRSIDIDSVVEELKKQRTEDISEFLSTHPPIPKRIRFLDMLAQRLTR